MVRTYRAPPPPPPPPSLPALQLTVVERWHTRTAAERWSLLKLSCAWQGRAWDGREGCASKGGRRCRPCGASLLSAWYTLNIL